MSTSMPGMVIPPIGGLTGHFPTIVYPVAASGGIPRNTLEPIRLRTILSRLDGGFYESVAVMDAIAQRVCVRSDDA
jgi:hypothetical protein